MGDRFLSSAGAGGNCARPMRLPDPSPVLDKNRAPMGPEILSSTGAGVWRKAPMTFSDSSSVLDKFQSAILGTFNIDLSNSVLTLYGLILAPTLNLFKLRFWFWELLTAHLSPKFALECPFKLRFSPEIEKGSLNKLKIWSLTNRIETPIL